MFVKVINENLIECADKFIIVGEKRICNPTEEILRSNGYKELVTSNAPSKYCDCTYIDNADKVVQVWTEWSVNKKKKYYDDFLVNEKIRQKYSENAEFAILRQRDEKAEEFAEYTAYCEQCKIEAKTELNLI